MSNATTNFGKMMASIKQYIDDSLKRYKAAQESNLMNYPKINDLGKAAYSNKYEDLYGIPEIPNMDEYATNASVQETLGRLMSDKGKVNINYTESNGELTIKMGENSSSIVEYNNIDGNLTIIE